MVTGVRSRLQTTTVLFENSQLATQMNLDFDLNLTGTERIHMFVKPLDDGVEQTRVELGGNTGKRRGW